MKQQIKWSLLCAQENVVNRKNSGEIFGYDFCIDDDLQVWLIEINASPDFSFSSVRLSGAGSPWISKANSSECDRGPGEESERGLCQSDG